MLSMVRLLTLMNRGGPVYKFISYAEYLSSDYLVSHPNARVNLEQTEVVLSLSCSASADIGCLTYAEARAYINLNWEVEPV